MNSKSRARVQEILSQLSQPRFENFFKEDQECTKNFKSAELSYKARVEGNLLYVQKRHDAEMHEEIWQKYSTSIALAPKASEELAVAFGNRSAFLLHLGKHQDCIRDVDRATEITSSNSLKVKLLCRKVECLRKLGLPGAEETLEKARYWHAKDEVEVDKDESHDLMNLIRKAENFIQQPSKEDTEKLHALDSKYATNDFSTVSVKYDRSHGKHLVANRDIKPGEVIFIEKYHTAALNTEKAYAFCSHCFKISWSMIPCDVCSCLMFCSDECKNEAWGQYHEIECILYSHGGSSEINNQLSIRLLMMAIKEAGNVGKLSVQINSLMKNKDNPLEYFLQDGRVQSCGFNSIFKLRNNYADGTLSDDSVLTALLLAKYTTLFGKKFQNIDSKKLADSKAFVHATYLLNKLYEISKCNSKEMNYFEIKYKGEKTKYSNSGMYLAPITSLMNHSCNPNASKCCIDGNRVVIYASQPIKKNTRITDTYLGCFFQLPLQVRRFSLQSFYNVTCHCEACSNDWPAVTMNIDFRYKHAELHEYAHTIYEDPEEMALYKENAEVIKRSVRENVNCDEEMFNNLSTSIVKGLTQLPVPSNITCQLIMAIQRIFDNIHGIKLCFPNRC